jgi:cell division protein FtsB
MGVDGEKLWKICPNRIINKCGDSYGAYNLTLSARPVRRISFLVLLAAAGVYAFVSLRGPNGIPALTQKRHEIRVLQEQNADLAREVQLKREFIRQLESDRSRQELEIRRRLKLLLPGETSFIIPEDQKPVTPEP